MSIKYCARCGEATGNAGVYDGSLMLDTQPYCDDCFQEVLIETCDDSLYAITRLQAEVQRLTAENEEIAKIFDEQSTLTDNAEAERDAMREQLRWRKWPDEKPKQENEDGSFHSRWYLTLDSHGTTSMNWWTSKNWCDWQDVTHWMPIPQDKGSDEGE